MGRDRTATQIIFTQDGAVIREKTLAPPGPGQVLLKAGTSLISAGTESTFYSHIRWNIGEYSLSGTGLPLHADHMELQDGLEPGYSMCGVVAEVGPGVARFKPGDRAVALSPHASLALVDDLPQNILPVPPGLPDERAAFSTLASVALHIVRRANIRLGEPVAVIGMGTVGLLVLQLARAAGAGSILAVDPNQKLLALAKTLGADRVTAATGAEMVQEAWAATGGKGIPCVIDAVGVPGTLQASLRMAATCGRVVVLGAIMGEAKLDLFSDFIWRQVDLIPAQQPRCPTVDNGVDPVTQQANRTLCLQMLLDGRLRVDNLVTHRFAHTEAPAVYEKVSLGKKADYAGDAAGPDIRDMIGVLLEWE